MKKKSAILFGATGLTGSHVLRILNKDERYGKIKIFSRTEPLIRSDKTEIFITSLTDIATYEKEINGDDLFCCLGTTIRKAGSKENFRQVDYEFPVTIAGMAARNKVPGFIIVSSIGANHNSSGFYLRTKGEMERAVQELDFKKLVILRPSILLGKRQEMRPVEEAGKLLAKIAGPVIRGRFRKYRAIEAQTVARAMVNLANIPTGKNIFESDEIEQYAKF